MLSCLDTVERQDPSLCGCPPLLCIDFSRCVVVTATVIWKVSVLGQ